MSSDSVSGLLDWAAATRISQTQGDSFFILDDLLFRANFLSLLAAFCAHYPTVSMGYSYKTNYTPHLCRIVNDLGGYAEVVSDMEYRLAKRLGVPPQKIIFNGPYKSEAAFKEALLAGATINLDNLRDLNLVREVAASSPTTQLGVVIRCNFDLGTGRTSRFGFDVEGREFKSALNAVREGANTYLKGLHCHFPDRDLVSFSRRARRMVALIREIFTQAPPELVNIGGGYAGDMPDSLKTTLKTSTVTFSEYASVVGGIFADAFRGYARYPNLFLEPGTALVANTIQFYTKVVAIKTIAGRALATTAGSLFDISPYSRMTNLPVTVVAPERDSKRIRKFDVVGYTCIENDILARDLEASLNTDDFLCFENVGSYSIVMKPPFILPANPILVRRKESFEVIRERETDEQIFRTFRF